MSKRSRRLRVKVALRPKQRSRRNLLAGSFLAVLLLGGAAAAALRHVSEEIGAPISSVIKNSLAPSLLALEVVGQPESVRQAAQDFLKARGPLAPGAAAEALKDEFRFMETVTVRRDWFRRLARLEFSLRSAAAPATLKGKPAGYLSPDGVVFSAPEGLYSVAEPLVEAHGASAADLRVGAAIALASRDASALPSPLRRLRWTSAETGWEAVLDDGTEILWGDGRWTADKLQRLREVLADARSQSASTGRLGADLRYFEDGRVLLRPLPGRAVSQR